MSEYDRASRLEAQAEELIDIGRYDLLGPVGAELLELDPECVYAQTVSGLAAMYGSGDVKAAETHLREAMRLDPNWATAPTELSCLMEHLGNRSEARRLIDTAVSADPNHARAWLLKGWIAFRMADYRVAEECVDHKLNLEPTCVETRDLKILLALKVNRISIDEAKCAYEELLQDSPNNARLHHRMGTLALLQGEAASGRDFDREALRLAPEHRQYQQFLVDRAMMGDEQFRSIFGLINLVWLSPAIPLRVYLRHVSPLFLMVWVLGLIVAPTWYGGLVFLVHVGAAMAMARSSWLVWMRPHFMKLLGIPLDRERWYHRMGDYFHRVVACALVVLPFLILWVVYVSIPLDPWLTSSAVLLVLGQLLWRSHLKKRQLYFYAPNKKPL